MKDKIKTSSFWLGLGGAVVLCINCLSDLFGVTICEERVEGIIVTICSVLVMLGIITKKNVSDTNPVSKDELIVEIENFNNDNENKNID